MLVWKDCNEEDARQMEAWLYEYGNSSENIKKYALFDETFLDCLNGYLKLKDKNNYIKCIFENDILIGFIVLNYGEYDKIWELNINPIVVCPRYLKQGYGEKIVKDLIFNLGNILKLPVDRVCANIDKENYISLKLFKKVGFKFLFHSNDRYDFYGYELKNDR